MLDRRPPPPVMPRLGKVRAVNLDAILGSTVDGYDNVVVLQCLGRSTWMASRAASTPAYHATGEGPAAALLALRDKVARDRDDEAADCDLSPALAASLAAGAR
jgi:hypothetical protein